jgi:hypothetical protein
MSWMSCGDVEKAFAGAFQTHALIARALLDQVLPSCSDIACSEVRAMGSQSVRA